MGQISVFRYFIILERLGLSIMFLSSNMKMYDIWSCTNSSAKINSSNCFVIDIYNAEVWRNPYIMIIPQYPARIKDLFNDNLFSQCFLTIEMNGEIQQLLLHFQAIGDLFLPNVPDNRLTYIFWSFRTESEQVYSDGTFKICRNILFLFRTDVYQVFML